MSILGSLTDVFTGNPAKEAAAKTQSYLSGVQNNGQAAIGAGLGAASNALSSGANSSLANLGAAYGTSTGAVNQGYGDASGALASGYNAGNSYFDQAAGAYVPLTGLAAKYGGATTLGLNALGVNGQAGTDAARSAFTASPGYNFNLDQGINSIARLHNAQGGGNGVGGNTDRDAQTYGAGLASNEYNGWLNNLLGFTNPELQATSGAASGVAGVRGAQAGAANTYGQNQAGLDTGRAGMLSGLAQQYGGAQAGINTGLGTGLAGLQTGAAGQQVGLGTALAQPYANTYGQEAAAQMQGSGNLWGLALNGAKLAAGGFGNAAGGAAAPASGSIPKYGNFNLPSFG